MLNLTISENPALWAYLVIPDMFTAKAGGNDEHGEAPSEREILMAKAREAKSQAA